MAGNSNISVNNDKRQLQQCRINSLPDELLIEILSHLPTISAVTTSLLSHRWRHLWTRLTRLEFDYDYHNFDTQKSTFIINQILHNLTSPKLRTFDLNLSSLDDLPTLNVAEPWFLDVVRRRNVEEMIVNVVSSKSDPDIFMVPSCVFNSECLVIMNFFGTLDTNLPNDGGIRLPNLKKLCLSGLVNVPSWMVTFYKCCPRLEDLNLMFDLFFVPQPKKGDYLVNIIFPNLKSLKIRMNSLS